MNSLVSPRGGVRSIGTYGFSVVELLTVMLIAMMVAGLSVMGFKQASIVLSATSGEDIVGSKLRMAHEMAMSQRKFIVVNFTDPGTIQILQQTSKTTSTLLEESYLPLGTAFTYNSTGQTPDNMTGLVSLRNTSFVFAGDGSARDNVIANNLINGVIYFGNSNSPSRDTLIAVTVLGTTGRVRTYHYNSQTGAWF